MHTKNAALRVAILGAVRDEYRDSQNRGSERRSFPCTWCIGPPGTLDHWLFSCPGMFDIQAPPHIKQWAQSQPPCTRNCGIATTHTDLAAITVWHAALAALVLRIATKWRHDNPDHPTKENADLIEAWCQSCEEQGLFNVHLTIPSPRKC